MSDEKNNSKVVNPHDKVFREVYTNKENARSLLADKLPDKVLKLIDLDTQSGCHPCCPVLWRSLPGTYRILDSSCMICTGTLMIR
jgi:hypothetical protein